MKQQAESGTSFKALFLLRASSLLLARGLLLAVLAFSVLSPVLGQGAEAAAVDDFETALFGTGDESGGQSGIEAEGGQVVIDGSDVARIETLVGGTVVAQSNTVFSGDLKSVQSLANASGKIFAKVSVPDYGALYIAYNASHYFFQGYGGNTSAFAVFDPYSPSYALAELHYSFDISKILFIRIGNQLIAWGPSRIWIRGWESRACVCICLSPGRIFLPSLISHPWLGIAQVPFPSAEILRKPSNWEVVSTSPDRKSVV